MNQVSHKYSEHNDPEEEFDLFPLIPQPPCLTFLNSGSCNSTKCCLSHSQVWLPLKEKFCLEFLSTGNCPKGTQCPKSSSHLKRLTSNDGFPHSKSPPCLDFLKKGCSRPQGSCKYDHKRFNDYEDLICWQWVRFGTCDFGVKCQWFTSHLPRLTSRPFAEYSPEDLLISQIESFVAVNPPCPQFLFQRCPNGNSCSKGSHSQEWTSLKPKLCKFWILEGKCSRGDTCKYSNTHLPVLLSGTSSLSQQDRRDELIRLISLYGKPCGFHFTGKCTKVRCRRSHDKIFRKSRLCKHWFHSGKCPLNQSCPSAFSHISQFSLRGVTSQSLGTDISDSDSDSDFDEYPLDSDSDDDDDDDDDTPETVTNYFDLGVRARIDRYSRVVERALGDSRINLFHDIKLYQDCVESWHTFRETDDLENITKSKIVGVTTSGAAKYQNLLIRLDPSIILCEEAGEVLESHILASLPKDVNHLVLIGDHQQLRPKVDSFQLTADAGTQHNLDISMFERLIVNHSLPVHTLHTQRRMRLEISALIKPFYPELQDSPPPIHEPFGFAKNLWFFDHDWKEFQKTQSSSKSNPTEAAHVVQLVIRLLRNGYKPEQIAIITPYLGQLFILRAELAQNKMVFYLNENDHKDLAEIDQKDLIAADADDTADDTGDDTFQTENPKQSIVETVDNMVRLATVDNFQGEESDIVIISTVRCNSKGIIGFLQFDNRVNVMMSRARHGMYIFGSTKTITQHWIKQKQRNPNAKKPLFSTIIDQLRANGNCAPYIDVTCRGHDDFSYRVKSIFDWKKFPDGGCAQLCNKRMACGHVCPRYCHGDDIDHSMYKCNEKCPLPHPKCGHSCVKLCYQDCGNCKKTVPWTCPACKQSSYVPCFKVTSGTVLCWHIKNFTIPWCFHMKQFPCHIYQKLIKDGARAHLSITACTQPCGGSLKDCGHKCQSPCGKCVQSTLLDGATPSPTDSLTTATDDMLKGKELPISRTVHSGVCQKRCEKLLFCTHLCNSLCHFGKECPDCSLKCSIRCKHSTCPHSCSKLCSACAEKCDRFCPHQKNTLFASSGGFCPVGCSSPCTLLPCDKRCTKKLSCGHQCPSICGEECPPKEYCHQCGTTFGDSRVDFISFETYSETDPNNDPIIRLGCGHFYTIDSLDGICHLEQFYSKDDNNAWLSPKRLSATITTEMSTPGSSSGSSSQRTATSNQISRPTCPDCKMPITGINRYRRVFKHFELLQLEKKFIIIISLQWDKIQGYIYSTLNELVSLKLSDVKIGDEDATFSAPKRFFRHFNREKTKVTDLEKKNPFANVAKFSDKFWINYQKKTRQDRIDAPYMPPRSLLQIKKIHLFLAVLEFILKIFKVYHNTMVLGRRNRSATPLPLLENFAPIKAKLDDIRSFIIAHHWKKSMINLDRELCLFAYNTVIKSCFHFFKAPGMSFESPEERDLRQIITQYKNHVKAHIVLKEPSLGEKLFKEIENYSPLFGLSSAEKEIIFTVMNREFGGVRGGFGSHWKICPCGYIYTVADCGGATVTATCPECGQTIGGTQHRNAEGNRDIDRL